MLNNQLKKIAFFIADPSSATDLTQGQKLCLLKIQRALATDLLCNEADLQDLPTSFLVKHLENLSNSKNTAPLFQVFLNELIKKPIKSTIHVSGSQNKNYQQSQPEAQLLTTVKGEQNHSIHHSGPGSELPNWLPLFFKENVEKSVNTDSEPKIRRAMIILRFALNEDLGKTISWSIHASTPHGVFTLPFRPDEEDWEEFNRPYPDKETNPDQPTTRSLILERGQTLFNRIFDLQLRQIWTRLKARLADNSLEFLDLHVVLPEPVGDSDLQGLPWFELHDGEAFLGLQPKIGLSLTGAAIRPKTISPFIGEMRGLLVNYMNLLERAGDAKQIFFNRFNQLDSDFTFLEKPNLRALREAIRAKPFNIFHYFGHGNWDPLEQMFYLQFQNQNSEPTVIFAEDLAGVIGDRPIQLAFLGSCYSAGSKLKRNGNRSTSPAEAMLSGGSDHVIAFTKEIGIQDLNLFSNILYEELGQGSSIAKAAALARTALKTNSIDPAAWCKAQLFRPPPPENANF